MSDNTPQLPLFTIVRDGSLEELPPILPITKRQIKDLTGQRFGRLVVLGFVGQAPSTQAKWLCKCDCGNYHVVVRGTLVGGYSRSCGCLIVDVLNKRNTTHGMSHVAGYKLWRAMIDRCERPAELHYDRYGGRGITVCERWRNSLECFLEDMGPRPGPEYTIDRIDNDLGYFPENCRWATRREQSRNTSRNRILEWGGESMTLVEWSEKVGIHDVTIHWRLSSGWSVEEALTTPVKHPRSVRSAGYPDEDNTTETAL